jgi:hypothetical protein
MGSFKWGRSIVGGLVSSAGPVGATNREEGLLDGQEVDAAPFADTTIIISKQQQKQQQQQQQQQQFNNNNNNNNNNNHHNHNHNHNHNNKKLKEMISRRV